RGGVGHGPLDGQTALFGVLDHALGDDLEVVLPPEVVLEVRLDQQVAAVGRVVRLEVERVGGVELRQVGDVGRLEHAGQPLPDLGRVPHVVPPASGPATCPDGCAPYRDARWADAGAGQVRGEDRRRAA